MSRITWGVCSHTQTPGASFVDGASIVHAHSRHVARLDLLTSIAATSRPQLVVPRLFEESEELSAHTLVLARFKPAGQSATAPVRPLFPQQQELCCLRG